MIHDKAMNDKIESLRRAVTYGTMNDKRNVIADLDVLRCLFEMCDLQSAAPDLLAACEFAEQWLSGEDAEILRAAIAKAKGK